MQQLRYRDDFPPLFFPLSEYCGTRVMQMRLLSEGQFSVNWNTLLIRDPMIIARLIQGARKVIVTHIIALYNLWAEKNPSMHKISKFRMEHQVPLLMGTDSPKLNSWRWGGKWLGVWQPKIPVLSWQEWRLVWSCNVVVHSDLLFCLQHFYNVFELL